MNSEWARHFLTAQRYAEANRPQFESWRAGFLERCRANPTARSAWSVLCGREADDLAMRLLWRYANSSRRWDAMREQGRKLATILDRAARALRVAEEHAGDPRRIIFVERANVKVEEALNAKQPFQDTGDFLTPESEVTLRDSINAGKNLLADNPLQSAKDFKDAARYVRLNISWLDERVLLFALKLHAADFEITLGAGRISVLAAVSREGGRAPDVSSLKRLFRMLSVDPQIVEEFRKQLQPRTRLLST